jgi:hypothetical protein
MADRKISDLTALTTPASGDYLPIVDISEAAASDKNKRITIEELMRGVPDGTVGAPGIAFESDPNTGIYSPGADQVAVATNGTGRLFINAIGQIAAGAGLDGSISSDTRVLKVGGLNYLTGTNGTSGKQNFKTGLFYNALPTGSNSANAIVSNASSDYLPARYTMFQGTHAWETATSATAGSAVTWFERMRITSAGLVGIGAATLAATSKLQVFSDAGGRSVFRHASGDGGVTIAGSQAASSSSLIFGNTWDTENGANFVEEYRLFFDGSTDSLAFKYNNNVAEAMRLDSSGRLLVGTSTARSPLTHTPSVQVEGLGYETSTVSVITNSNDTNGAYSFIGKSRGTSLGSNTIVQSGDEIGGLDFIAADGTQLLRAARITALVDGTPGANDMPGRIVLSTTAAGASSPTERMRITSTGQVRLAGAGITFNGDTAAANELDDYEEGTFTPTIEGTTTAGTATYTRQAGVYTKVGRQVFYAIDVIYASGTGTGDLRIAGLPFTSGSVSMLKTGAISADNIALTAGNYPRVTLSLNSTVLLIQQLPTGGGAPSSVPYDAAGQLILTGHYFV